jgi:DNA-binding PadR family transcriptional regulator
MAEEAKTQNTEQPKKFLLLCPACKKPVAFKREDSVQKWYVCENNHETAEGCLIKQEIDEMLFYGLKIAEKIDQQHQQHLLVWQSPELLKYIFTDLNRRVKYDKITKTSVFFSGISAYLPEPLNLFEKGPSGSGKTYNAVQTLEYFPGGDIWFLGGMSPKALVHQHGKLLDKDGEEIDLSERPEKPLKKDHRDEEEFKEEMVTYKQQKKAYYERLKESYHYININNKIFVFLEAPDPETMRMLYPILSHDKRRLEYQFVDKSQSGLRTIKVVVEGWPSAIFLTTDRKYVEELSTRSFTVSPEETTEKFEASNRLTNLKASLPWECELETVEYRTIKALIESIKDALMKEEIDVVIPFLDLYTEFPKDIPRDMRDFSHFTQFLKAFTILHLYQRPYIVLGEKKYVLTTAQDVINGYTIFKELFESTRTGTEQRVLNFYYEFMLGKNECHVSELTTEYNQNRAGKSISDFTIRYWLERLNEIGYVEKREDPSDKRKNIYIPLVKQKQELRENTLNSENHIDLATILKNSFETWKTNIRKTTPLYYKNILEKTATTLEDIEPMILGTEEITSIFDTDLFKYPDKAKTEQESGNKPKDTLKPEIQTISSKLDALVSKTKLINRLQDTLEDTCHLCGFKGRMDWEIADFDSAYALLCGPCGEKVAERLNKP